MRNWQLSLVLAVLALAGCGGDDGSESATTSAGEGAPSTAESGELQFAQVESFTLNYLEGAPAVSKECNDLGWVEDQAQAQELAPFIGTKTVEVLTCDDVPYLAYLEYEDATAAEEGLASALLPYLAASDTTVVMPLIGLDEATAADYLEALKGECACGEVVEPAQ